MSTQHTPCEACTSGTMAGLIPGTLANGERCDMCQIYECDDDAKRAVDALIAAAPELLATCELVLSEIESGYIANHSVKAERCRYALAEALKVAIAKTKEAAQ